MRHRFLLAALLVSLPTVSLADGLSLAGRAGGSAPIRLMGPDARQQVIVTLKSDSEGHPRDVTHRVRFQLRPAGVAEFVDTGFLRPLKDGTATLTASLGGASSVSIPIHVERAATPLPINFANEVVPILTRYGCNGGGCHGKSGGQNGFQLSLLGYEPWNDYEYLVREARGRRLFPAAPEHSLLLTKATGQIPHGGGARLHPGTHEYEFLLRWIRQGMPYGEADDPSIERIQVFPKHRVGAPERHQQLQVTAHYSDGSTRDITRAVQYEANQEDMAEVTEHGLVTYGDLPGSTAVMVRFQEHVDVFIADIPLGAPVEVPEPRNFVDHHIFRKWKLLGLPPSQPADDATFLRRVTLDLAGRLPTKGEALAFLEGNSPSKRSDWIDQLLESADHAAWFANKWAAILRNKRTQDEYARGTYAFHDWLRTSFAENRPFDVLVTELLTAAGDPLHNPPVSWYRAVSDPKEQMQDVAQVFLGIRMQCAQCHHHPYEKWSQDDYYGFAAYFSTLKTKPAGSPGERTVFHQRKNAAFANPNTGEKLPPTPLGGEPTPVAAEEDPRYQLAQWMRDRDNPFFARKLVNRYWKHFFGRGLVEPEDDLRVTNPATHPKLLEDLATYFVVSGYNVRDLIRVIVNSHTYQLSAEPNAHNGDDRQNYSRYYPRRLPAEILLDAINAVSQTENAFQGQERGTRAVALPDDHYNQQVYFLSVFGRPSMESACECERSVDANLAQSLHLINSKTIQQKLTANDGRAANLAEQSASDADRLEELYLNAFSRRPTASEFETAIAHLEKKRKAAPAGEAKAHQAAEREAFEDILWALLNTKEFLFNH